MAWTGLVLTVEGRNALNHAQLSNAINFKSIVVGDGIAPANFGTLKGLVHQLYEITAIKIDVTDDRCIITADFPKVEYDYYFREIGVIVTTGDGDKLYVYDNCGDNAQYIVSSMGVETTKKRIRLSLKISDVDNITVSEPQILYVSYDEYEGTIERLDSHEKDTSKHVTEEKQKEWDKKQTTTGDAKDNVVTFTSEDDENPTSWTNIVLFKSKEKFSSLLNKVSIMAKNVRYLYKIIGTTDISSVGDGTVTNAIKKLKEEQPGSATQTLAGLLSAADKKKLDGIADKANNYTHPESHAASMIAQDVTHRFVSDTEKNTWNNKLNKADVSRSTAVTVEGQKALDAIAENASIEGTLANEISQLNSKLSIGGGSRIDPNKIQTHFAIINGWDSAVANVPSGFGGAFGLLITEWLWGDYILTSDRVQVLLWNNNVAVRTYINNTWGEWGRS